MTPQKPYRPTIQNVYSYTVKSLKNQPFLFIPFLIFAIFEFISVNALFLAPRMPLRLVLGPIIRTFWGERFLHYPLNFLLLPKLISLSRMALTVLLGSLLTGMAVAIILNIYEKNTFKLRGCFISALKRYISLFIVVFIYTILFYGFSKITAAILVKYFMAGHSRLLFLGPRLWMGPILLSINFVVALLIQSAFIYSIPILIIEKEKLARAIIRSFILFKRLFFHTFILVGLPMLAYIPIVILYSNAAVLIDKAFPELILLVAFSSIVISSLVIDPLVTISTTVLYLMNKEKNK